MLTQQEILAKFESQTDLYDPIQIVSVERLSAVGLGYRPDATITLALQNRNVVFSAEIKTRTSPKTIAGSLWRLRNVVDSNGRNFLLVVPYLSQAIVEMLKREEMSGIDLNGNYFIQVSGMLAVRLDRKNGFPESQPIRNIFAGSSSLVGRLFLVSGRRFNSVNEVFLAIKNLGGSLSLSAVSKVLKGLEDDLIIEKAPDGIRLLQPEKLLQKLGENYRQPRISESVKLRIPGLDGKLDLKEFEGMADIFSGSRWVFSGESSARRYAVMADDSIPRVYLADYGPLLKYQDDRFYNLLAQRTSDLFPFFDMRDEKGVHWASPVQCWLELSRLDKREREMAVGVRQGILGG